MDPAHLLLFSGGFAAGLIVALTLKLATDRTDPTKQSVTPANPNCNSGQIQVDVTAPATIGCGTTLVSYHVSADNAVSTSAEPLSTAKEVKPPAPTVTATTTLAAGTVTVWAKYVVYTKGSVSFACTNTNS